MSVFATAVNAIFADANMAVDASRLDGGEPPALTIRVVRRRPDGLAEFGPAKVRQGATRVDVRASEWPQPKKGDHVMIDAETFVVQASPEPDRLGLVWSLDLRPA